MEPGSSRATTVVASAGIVATVALLAFGILAGQPGGQQVLGGRATVQTSHDSTVAATAGTPTTAQAHGGHTTAVSAGGPDESAEHTGHTDTDAVADAVADAVVPAIASHDQHVPVPAEVVTTVPGATTLTTIHDHSVTTVPSTTVPGAPTATPPTTVATGPFIAVNDSRLTAAQRAAAVDLIARTKAAMHAFENEAAVVAAGYVSIGDGVTGFEHFVNVGYLTDDHEVDPNHIESIVLSVSGGTKTVESAMYILTTGETMTDVPDIAGELTTWHDHQNLCWEGIRVVGVTDANGDCARGEFRPTAPMLHVWITEQPCGPFAGIEGHSTGGCLAH